MVMVGVRPYLPAKGVQFLLGNDLAGGRVIVNPIVTDKPSTCDNTEQLQKEIPNLFPACAVTRAMSQKLQEVSNSDHSSFSNETNSKHREPPKKCPPKEAFHNSQAEFNLADTFLGRLYNDPDPPLGPLSSLPNGVNPEQSNSVPFEVFSSDSLSREQLLLEQEKDPELTLLCDKAITEDEAENVPVCFYLKKGILMRKWRPPDVSAFDEWRVYHQVVVPKVYRSDVLSLAHETPFSGHLGVNKTYHRILNHFFWPNLKKDVSYFCRTCHTCQLVGKPNQTIPPAPLKPIPAFEEPFSRVIIDCVGPLPKTKSGNQYMLTIMCASTRFPEAIPVRDIKAKTVCKVLIKFFTLVGLPKSVQSDQGSNFMSRVFQQAMYQLNIRQVTSSAYHPQSQGALERFHQTLKSMIRTYCFENVKDWDEGVHFLMFAARESIQESLGFSPFELVFGHRVRGPLKMLKEKWMCETEDLNILDYVCKFKYRLHRACEIARENLKSAQNSMKLRYDKRAVDRSFSPGNKVLVFLPVPNSPLHARYFGPYVIHKKVSDTDYIVLTPDRRKSKRLCHINMLKKYYERNSKDNSFKITSSIVTSEVDCEDEVEGQNVPEMCIKLQNSDVMSNLDKKLCHLSTVQSEQIGSLLRDFSHLFSDSPTRTNLVYHDVDVGDSKSIKQHPYRMNPVKSKHLRDEIQYMLKHDIIEPSDSEWSSPCILVPKPDGSFRFCTDYRKVNTVTRTDSYPIPRVDDCIDRIGNARFVTKFDLLKGYWEIPLTDRAKRVSAFVTPDGLFQYKVMPFGMKNAPATFQRLLNNITASLENCEVYIDDIIVYSNSWYEHVTRIRSLFEKLTEANLTVNLVKSEIAHANVIFLGHVVGQGEVKPVKAKVEAIDKYPVPATKKQLMRFLGMARYYRRFCRNFSDVAAPLTNLLSKSTKFVWTESCQNAFDKIKAILMSSPVLRAPNFSKQFTLATDASDFGVGAVLLQVDDHGVDHPVCYFSKQFNSHQKNYSTIEKETLSLLLGLQHFDVYLGTTSFPIIVLTDHNPLTFLQKMRNKNQRLIRWSLFLQQYNLCIKHIKGKENVIPDVLSRA
ncbi:uncharacterized protein [Apostichopus japonicus]|uniref:uncharacterized protein n=1 Tax=Stichopus japonicus TaxID=307972 RepID=UPI003AB84B04